MVNKEDEEGSVSVSEGSHLDSLPRTTTASGADPMLAQQETKWVLYSKICVLLVLLLAALSASSGVYFVTQESELAKFETRFQDFARQILSVSQVNARHIFETYKALSLDMTSRTNYANDTWPFITFEYYESLVGEALKNTGANFVGFTPLVKNKDRKAYEAYAYANQGWMQDALEYTGNTSYELYPHSKVIDCLEGFVFDHKPCPTKELYAPVRHLAPILGMSEQIGFDAFSYSFFARVYDGMIEAGEAVLSEIMNLGEEQPEFIQDGPLEQPASFMAAPIFLTRDQTGDPVGVLTAEMPWYSYFTNLLPEDIDSIFLVVRNTCNQTFTYLIDGPDVTFLGGGDRHDPTFTEYRESDNFTTFVSIAACRYSFDLYPSDEFMKAYQTDAPKENAMAVFIIFVSCMLVFIGYDCLVERRKKILMASATKTGLLVNSLFPENVRDRLLEDALLAAKKKGEGAPQTRGQNRNFRSSTTSDEMPERSGLFFYENEPIADLFPSATVLFADLVGFTAWSSVREPPQVFILLETVYNNFDLIAKKLGVFKVETIGDCYVAATGLPVPRQDHAVAMARFARYCMAKLNELVFKLEIELGIGTSELAMRFGLHSGPVTAGVLRGEKSRFQLFGDTVNTAARMESNGKRDRIHVSQETADLLIEAGKSQWITKREDKIVAKGKGEMQTYWVSPRLAIAGSSTFGGSSSNEDLVSSTHSVPQDSALDGEAMANLPTQESSIEQKDVSLDKRLIEWNMDLLRTLLKKVIATRDEVSQAKREELVREISLMRVGSGNGATALDEVEEAITFPEKCKGFKRDPNTVAISAEADAQLHDYISRIASLYRNHPFHSFAHATHAGQSVSKLVSRIVSAKSINYNEMSYKPECSAKMHSTTFGITSDPVAQFACAFAILLHDVDHPGVSNTVLINENSNLATTYKNRSIAEQSSLDVGWDLFMQPKYKDLRACIYTTQAELNRFRQLMVNTVLATDFLDEGLCARRNARWELAFSTSPDSSSSREMAVDDNTFNRKATLVVEHLVQASDLSHMMQHWHIYTKWNEKLFVETYQAFKAGRIQSDPEDSWYEGELNFFDNTVIPLAAKLKQCGVFGPASDEYLTYAEGNRKEWEAKGRGMVSSFLAKYKQ